MEWEYADDGDFIDTDLINLQKLFPISKDILEQWNLVVNEEKTEYVHFYIATKDELDEIGNKVKDNEPWRKSKALGSMLCSITDVKHRMTLCDLAFQKYQKVWLKGAKIPLKKKLLIYNAQVLSVLLYNSSSWSLNQDMLNKVDACHRKHLRYILNMHWPHGCISNESLYLRCNAKPISKLIEKSRWTLFGHLLRSPETNPASLALHFAVVGTEGWKGRVGRPQANLLDVIRKDLEKREIYMNNLDDLYKLYNIASDRAKWRSLAEV